MQRFRVQAVMPSAFSRMVDLLTDQAAKAARRPSRLIIIPLGYLMGSRWGSLLSFILRLIPQSWIAEEFRNELYFVTAFQYLERNRPERAWPWLERCLQTSTTPRHFYLGAICPLHGFGRFRDAKSLLERANELAAEEAQRLGIANGRYRLLDRLWATNIGHIANLDYVIKLGVLEGRRRDDTILYVPAGSSVANRFLLQQWRTQLRLVERAADLPIDEVAVPALRFDFLGPRLADGTTGFLWELAAKTQRRWHAEGRCPLLTLPAEIEQRGRRALQQAGIPAGAWFVALHVREARRSRTRPGLHQVLNANVMDYLPAIAEITRRGGWVIRMGGPAMTPLPALPKVLDYCHSELRADWMDIFIAACCRFMLGTSSGPAYVPSLYGVPCVLTNWWPPAQPPWHPTDIFVPKMLRRSSDGGLLTLGETLVEPFSFCHCLDYLADPEGVRVEPNHPDIITAAVVEMLDRLDGVAPREDGVSELRERASRIYESCGAFGDGQLARGFLQRYGSFVQ